MAASISPVKTLSASELDDRRFAVENAIGTLRIEGLELDPDPARIIEQYAQGDISLEEMSRQINAYTATID
jgi:hypothetical protein